MVRTVRRSSDRAVGGPGTEAGPPRPLAQQGTFAFDLGTFFCKGQAMGTGQADVTQYDRALRNVTHRGLIDPARIVSQELSLEQAVESYKNVDDRLDEGRPAPLRGDPRTTGEFLHRDGAGTHPFLP